jgi:general secretion pathway protein D
MIAFFKTKPHCALAVIASAAMVIVAQAQQGIPPQKAPATADSPTQRPVSPNATPPPGAGRPGQPFSRPQPVQPTPPPNGAARSGAPSQEARPKPPAEIEDTGDGIALAFPNTPIIEILFIYEELTGLKIIRDAAVENATVSIETTGKLPKDQAIRYIEASLLLNGYSFIPAGEGMVKILSEGKQPVIEGAPIVLNEAGLDTSEKIVTYVTTLRYLTPDDAIKALQQVIPNHAYGKMLGVPTSNSLVIIDNTATIRAMLALLTKLDNQPLEPVKKTFQLTRSSSDDVQKALTEILEKDKEGSGATGSGGYSAPRQPQAAGAAPGIPQQGQAAASAGGAPISVSSGGGTSGGGAPPPKIISIPRRNVLLVWAQPSDIEMIGELIEELDAAADIRNFVSRELKYLGVEEAMNIISDAISRGQEPGAGGASATGGTASSNTNNSTTGNTSGFGNNRYGNSGLNGGLGNSGLGNSGFGNSGYGGSGLGGGLGGGLSGGGGNLQPLRQSTAPRSMVVGKTLLISDPVNNSIFLSGPPEHLEILNQIIDELDHRPKQVEISVVIGEYTLTDELQFGIDYLLRPTNLSYNKFDGTVAGGIRNTGAAILDPSAIDTLATLGEGLSSGLTAFGSISAGVNAIANTLQGNRNFKVISRPTLFTMNNTPATISSGSAIPVPTSTLNNFSGANNGVVSNIQFQPVELSLNIVPLINGEDELTLQVQQGNSEVNGNTIINDQPYPNLSQQQLSTTVMVKNNATVLLGGLIRENTEKQRNGIPLLNRIPLVKYLVSQSIDKKTRRELLIFIQPRIVTGEGDLPPAAQDVSGQSPFGDDMRKFMRQEHQKPVETPGVLNRVRGLLDRIIKGRPH